MTAEEFLALLEGAKRSGDGWMAKCPAHEDRSASLAVANGRNGGTILHCFAGCTPYEITGAVGVQMADLFPPRVTTYRPAAMPKFSPADVLRVMDLEVAVVIAAARTMANGAGISAKDYARLELANSKLSEARGWVG